MNARASRNASREADALAALHIADELFHAGRWREAERELAAAAKRFPAAEGAAILRLAELRRRQGRLQPAINLYKNLPHHPRAQLGMAAVMLDGDNRFGARDWLDRHLAAMRPATGVERAPGLALDVEIRIAHREWKLAEASAGELDDLARAVPAPALRGAVQFAQGCLAAARGDAAAACRRLDSAAREWQRAGRPFERARAQWRLSLAMQSAGRTRDSREALRTAIATFTALGARGELRRAAFASRPAPAAGRAGLAALPLNAREIQVLTLVGQGLPNARIAAKLGLSVYSVDFHLGDILERFNLPDRRAATAFLEKRGLR